MNKLKNIFTLTVITMSMVSFGSLAASQVAGDKINQAIENTAEQLKTEEIKQEIDTMVDEAAANADVYKAKVYELKEKIKVHAQKAIDQL